MRHRELAKSDLVDGLTIGFLLQRFLRETAGRAFVWGEDDCSLFLANWWRFVNGADPAAHLRGTYGTEADCHALVKGEGGLVRLVGRIAREAGAQPTRAPARGDMALIRAGGAIIGGICAGDLWAIRNEGGVGFVPRPRIIKAWRI